MLEKFELRNIRRLRKEESVYGNGMYSRDMTGYTKRQAAAWVMDHITGICETSEENRPTERQIHFINKYGHGVPSCRLIAQALIDDIGEQLDWDVISYEELCIGTKVVHVRNKRKPLVIRSLKPGEKVKFEGTSFTCRPRMLRRHRPDGDYTKTNIPNEYFWKGWLER